MPKPLPNPRSVELQQREQLATLHDQLVARYGNITVAAAMIRVPSGTLYRWLRNGFPYDKTHLIDKLLNPYMT
jgi:transcriptional regulator of acetoin/glycerol metabolism